MVVRLVDLSTWAYRAPLGPGYALRWVPPGTLPGTILGPRSAWPIRAYTEVRWGGRARDAYTAAC